MALQETFAMPLKESYVIWNNKGGVGKTTLTFHMATRYAERYQERKVLVIDLCPQASVTMALLSTRDKHGSDTLSQIYRDEKTVSFYLDNMTEPAVAGTIVQPSHYLTHVAQYNDQVPNNLVVLCGDMYLELVGRNLEHMRSGAPKPRKNPWVMVTSMIKSFIEGDEGIQGFKGVVQAEPDTEWVVFIDTNPAFSVYTEIALVAGKKLIIPINADDFSKEAVQKMLDLVYGIAPELEEPDNFKAYKEYMFSSKANQHNIRKPEIYLMVNNRATSYNGRSAKAYGGMAAGIIEVLRKAYEDHPECFSKKEQESFKAGYHVDIKDFHSTAVLSSHIGCPLSALSGKVDIFGETVKVDKVKVDLFLKCLDTLVEKL